MRTRENGFGQGLKKLAVLMMVAAIAVGCGKKNTSGKSDNGGVINTPGVGVGGGAYSGEYKNVILNENPCQTQGGQRISKINPIQTNVGTGLYAGVTSEGDVAFVYNGMMELYLCSRPGLVGTGNQFTRLVTNISEYCSVDEITSMTVTLPASDGYYNFNYTLNFRAIHFGNGSSLCGGNYYNHTPY